MYCHQCGHACPDEAKFCQECGASLTEPSMGDTTKVFPAVQEEIGLNELNADDLAAVESLSANKALLIVRRGSGAGSRFLLDQDVTTIGRHPDSDIFLDDITVSRHHAKFLREPEGITVQDLGSLNGTYVNRKLVDGSMRLKIGDEVQVGKFRLVFFTGEHGLS